VNELITNPLEVRANLRVKVILKHSNPGDHVTAVKIVTNKAMSDSSGVEPSQSGG
jgi:hypothetical protein